MTSSRDKQESGSSRSSGGSPHLTQILLLPAPPPRLQTPPPHLAADSPFHPVSVLVFPPALLPSQTIEDPNYTVSNNESVARQ